MQFPDSKLKFLCKNHFTFAPTFTQRPETPIISHTNMIKYLDNKRNLQHSSKKKNIRLTKNVSFIIFIGHSHYIYWQNLMSMIYYYFFFFFFIKNIRMKFLPQTSKGLNKRDP